MAALDWYDRNRQRSFPFRVGSVGDPSAPGLGALPDGLIADAGFVAGPRALFDPARHLVWLDSVRRAGASLFLSFATDAPGVTKLLVFERTLPLTRYESEFAESQATSCGDPEWWGFLVTADQEAVDDLLPGDGLVTRRGESQAVVEPTSIQVLAAAQVTSVTLATLSPTAYQPPADCNGQPQPDPALVITGRCLRGELELRPGYNCVVRQTGLRSVALSASVGAGRGQLCAPVELEPADGPLPARPPDQPNTDVGQLIGDSDSGSASDSASLSDDATADPLAPPPPPELPEADLCGDVVRSVNGVPGPSLSIVARGAVSVAADPASGRLIVTVVPGGGADPLPGDDCGGPGGSLT